MGINRAIINGYLLTDPRITISRKTGIEKVTFTVRTTHRHKQGSLLSSFDDLVVSCDDEPEIIRYMKTLKRFDLVEIKASLVIHNSMIAVTCPECGKTHVETVALSYVYPIGINKRDSLTGMFESYNRLPDKFLLDHYSENSNEIYAGAVLAREPVNISTTDKPIASYPASIRRAKMIKTQPDTKFDTPWITTVGNQAKQDMEYLYKGACVDITGFIHAVETAKAVRCEECGRHFLYKLCKMTISPYEVEYRFGKDKKTNHTLDHMSDEDYIAFMLLNGNHID